MIYPLWGGVEKVVERLANRLSQTYQVHIVSLHGDSANNAFNFDSNIKIELLDMNKGRLRDQMIEGTRRLKRYFKDNGIKVAFLEASYVGFIGAFVGLISSTKTVFCDHGALINQLDDKDITKMRRIAVALTNKTVVLTKQSKDDYIRLFRVKENKISYIYNWIDNKMISPERRYNNTSHIILTAGRFTKEKGYDLLLEVAKKLRLKDHDWEWHIYGNGPLQENISDKIEEYGLQGVIIKGFSEDMDEVYRNAAIYVLPSYREGMPLVLLEAIAYKLPSICFDIMTGPREIITDGVNGILIERYDTEKMADAINDLIVNETKRIEMSNNTYINLHKFEEAEISKQWETLIKELI